MFKRHGFPRRLFHRLQLPPGDVAVLTSAMRGARFSLVAGLVAIAALLAGCSSGPPTTPAAPAPTGTLSARPTAAATQPPDEYAIPDDPDDIDEEYVERVLEALNHGIVDATRAFAATGEVTPTVEAALAPTHTAEARESYLQTFRELEGTEDVHFRGDATAVDITSVDEIISASKQCIFVRVTQDTSGLVKETVRPFSNYFHLVAKAPAHPEEGNPTPWVIAGDAEPRADGKEYSSPCDE